MQFHGRLGTGLGVSKVEYEYDGRIRTSNKEKAKVQRSTGNKQKQYRRASEASGVANKGEFTELPGPAPRRLHTYTRNSDSFGDDPD
jgi:hypothetical protein